MPKRSECPVSHSQISPGLTPFLLFRMKLLRTGMSKTDRDNQLLDLAEELQVTLVYRTLGLGGFTVSFDIVSVGVSHL